MKFVIFFIVLIVVLLGLEWEETISTVPLIEKNSPSYGQRPLENSWPPTSENEKIVSDDLLTANYYIILDGSGSMEGSQCAEGSSKMAVAKTAITQFSQKIPAEANVALYSFDGRGRGELFSLSSENKVLFYTKIKEIVPGGGTPLATAIKDGYRLLTKQATQQLGYGEYHLVIVTDGIASSNEDPGQILRTILTQSPVMIHSIGFCLDGDHALNQTGLTTYTAAGNAEELKQGLQAVLSEAPDFSPNEF
ncbi:MAG: VWA domain-containing protein [Methylococcales bacterium]|nr:VWA domain-containing protein [Methylococcales bacterium]